VHLGETRHAAAIRKLREECGLAPQGVRDLGTYDVILEMDAGLRHGITTLFAMRVTRATPRLDAQSVEAAWRTPDDWLAGGLDDFVAQGLARMRQPGAS
jgi:ADP-ribose pyrophosphatase YjhB (NUDIX family)